MTKNELTEKFVEAMEKERTRRGYTQAQMASVLEMSVSAYRKIINYETTNITLYTAYLAYKLTGKLLFELVGERNEFESLIIPIRKLSKKQRAFIENIVDFETGFSSSEDGENENLITVIVPSNNLEDGMIWDSANFEKHNISAYEVYKDRINCGIKITTNNLYPVYSKDDILLIEKRPPRVGDVGIFINKETKCAYIRKVRHTEIWCLEPINDYGEVIYVNDADEQDIDKWIKFGRVICKMR